MKWELILSGHCVSSAGLEARWQMGTGDCHSRRSQQVTLTGDPAGRGWNSGARADSKWMAFGGGELSLRLHSKEV